VQNVTVATLRKFEGTTNAGSNLMADPPKVERSNYYDLGISRQMNKEWQVGIDGFYKQARNLVDLGQFGAPIIFAPFNYRSATVYGAELSSTYRQGGFSAFGNFSWAKTMAHDIDSQEFLIANDELAFIKTHNIHLDHDNEFAVSAGAAYAWKDDRVYVDFLYGSGLRSGFANTHQLESHYPVNLGYEHIFRLNAAGKDAVRVRFDVINVFDQSYELRNGSGIGVGASQFGSRRAFYLGLTYVFG
jgi:outer membrane receptor protein involved in Fe transport